MRSTRQVFALAAVVAVSISCIPAAYAARAVLTGQVAEERVKQLTEAITWHDDLKEAEAESQKTGKLIFWMHILGHIDGAT